MAAVAAADIFIYQRDLGNSLETTDCSTMKELLVETANTADHANTIAVDVGPYGWTKVARVKGFAHTSFGVVALEDPTTTVSGTVLTITVGGSDDNEKRVFLIGGY